MGWGNVEVTLLTASICSVEEELKPRANTEKAEEMFAAGTEECEADSRTAGQGRGEGEEGCQATPRALFLKYF